MPIQLPPISRRKFLAWSLTAAAGLALGPRLLAAGKKTDENLWALLSDTHIAADRAQIGHGVNMTDHLAAATRELIALPEIPAGVFITGDCAYNSGKTDDYATFANLIQPLRREGMPLHLTLGNHDNRERFWDALTEEKMAKRPLADKQAALLPTPRANWFLLDSLDKTLSTPGLIGREQLDWLAKSLDGDSGKPALILVHHNPGFHGKIAELKDTDALFQIIRPRKQVKACIFGHTHFWHVQQDESGIHLINLPPVAYVFEEGKPSGWVRATLEPDGMRIELCCVSPDKACGEVNQLKWRT
jgi:hypothetical protein